MGDSVGKDINSLKAGDLLFCTKQILGECPEDYKNKYKVIQRLGNGGNGVSYLVHCVEGKLIGNIFTMKLLQRMNNEGTKRFLREIQFIRENNHPSILTHYDEGTYEDYPFVVTEYLKCNLLNEIHHINMKEALIYSVQLLSAINYLQERNCVHRDIKPANIFFDNTNVVLGDFGLIKKLDKDDDIIETDYLRDAFPRQYRTPQLLDYFNGKSLDKKTDIFQLGLVLYFIFCKTNILKPPPAKTSPITKKSFYKFKRIESEIFGKRIMDLIKNMISLDSNLIKSSDELLREFQLILDEYFQYLEKADFKIFF